MKYAVIILLVFSFSSAQMNADSSKSVFNPEELNHQVGKEVLIGDNTFKNLGSYHQTMGVLKIVAGSAGFISGIVYIARNSEGTNNPIPSSLLIFAPSIATFSFGLWEINIGKRLRHL